ncbi:sodium/proline symporter [Methanolacinia petrolearia DSM 11571]|uniref:Sodium/proline symporter n=1 Tax=Methanolacinia petrolearia (strain DSM 11571 / OCM 486 / SEBR 4847) TaxID=679926 RepID=E1RD05_METP4|nr:sodium/proline symporter PutP [Methanolacinia petrolearia]ADN35905.1 sodium/proline symporter [Methanolacinia petrolearia DSM 11571]
MVGNELEILAAFVVYLGVMVTIGFLYYKKTNSVSDYILGGRGLNKFVTALSAEASDMSGWLLIGVPGLAYLSGMSVIWIAIGLIIGTFLNWKFIAKRLRVYTKNANDSLTLPDFFKNRFGDNSDIIGAISAIFILIFFLIYTSAQFVASGKLFNTVFGVDYTTALLIGSLIVVLYTFTGGFKAVCLTDFIQGCLMFFALLIVPIMALAILGGPGNAIAEIEQINPSLLNPFLNPDGSPLTIIAVVSMLAWGLGYFGQPHILVRFMAIKNPGEIKEARAVAMVWVIISLFAAVAIGVIGRVFLPQTLAGAESETVFMVMTGEVFFSFLAGIIFCGILAAIMSTASSQLLVSASAVSQDLYKTYLKSDATDRQLIWISRFSVLAVAICAIVIAVNPDSFVFNIVSYAWAGFGAAFGPIVIMALFWKRTTLQGALAGIIVGGLTVLIWMQFEFFGLYEIVPGFIFSMIAIYVVSIRTAPPDDSIVKVFEETEKELAESPD